MAKEKLVAKLSALADVIDKEKQQFAMDFLRWYKMERISRLVAAPNMDIWTNVQGLNTEYWMEEYVKHLLTNKTTQDGNS